MKGMIDNKKVKDSHQEGIARVMQRKSENSMERKEYCSGKLKGHSGSEANWKRSGKLTPREA